MPRKGCRTNANNRNDHLLDTNYIRTLNQSHRVHRYVVGQVEGIEARMACCRGNLAYDWDYRRGGRNLCRNVSFPSQDPEEVISSDCSHRADSVSDNLLDNSSDVHLIRIDLSYGSL